MTSWTFRLLSWGLFLLAFVPAQSTSAPAAPARPNLLIITVDDMSADSLGAFGCSLAETSPHIDALAAQGMKFRKAHVVVGNCMPSRNVMWSGLYPHHSGVEGFYQVPGAKHPHLADILKSAGYFTGIQGKVSHSTPYHPYPAWDVDLTEAPEGGKRHGKAAKSYGDGVAQGIRQAREAGKPFCLLINISDPHKPFYAEGKRGETIPDEHVPSRVFTPEEVPVPGFLFDDPVVRKELAHYYSSVRRADDCAGAILASLDASGERERTVILFLSDHGMPLPFAKTQVYHHSTNTPLFFVAPGLTKPGTEDGRHLVSTVDLLPTLLEVLGIPAPAPMDGRSFAPLLSGKTIESRGFVIKEYNENSGGSRDPMRAIQTDRYLYIFNPWSNGTRIMATATTGTPTYRRMAELAQTNPALGARHDLYQHRVPEELYDVERDPDCLQNLVASPEHRPELDQIRGMLEQWMVQSDDPMLDVFRKREDADAREAYVAAQESEAEARRAAGKGKGRGKNAGDSKPSTRRKGARLIELQLPESIAAGSPVAVRIPHRLPEDLGEQTLTVTLKGGHKGARIERKTVKARGKGVAEVSFDVPANAPGSIVSVAAFVGEDYQQNLQHVQSEPVPVR